MVIATVVVVCALVVLAVAHVVIERRTLAAISCADIDVALSPCIAYLTGQAADPAAACCARIGHIKSIAGTTADRQAACSCMKDAAFHLSGLKDRAVSKLPAKCKAPLPSPISGSVDCTEFSVPVL